MELCDFQNEFIRFFVRSLAYLRWFEKNSIFKRFFYFYLLRVRYANEYFVQQATTVIFSNVNELFKRTGIAYLTVERCNHSYTRKWI